MMIDKNFFNSATIEGMLASKRTEKWHSHPNGVIPLSLAETDFPVAPEIMKALMDGVNNQDVFYMGDRTIEKYREIMAAKIVHRNGIKATANDVMITHAVTATMWLAIQYACKEGDEVIVNNPAYGPFLRAIERTNTKPIYWDIFQEEGYNFNIEKLKEVITKKSKLIVICNPHNPTGRVMTKQELKGVADVAVDNNIPVWVDEVWEDIIFDGRKHISLASLNPDIERLTMTCWGFSKTFNVSGLRMGYLCAMNKEMMKRLRYIGEGVVFRDPPIASLAMAAIPVMLDETLDWYRYGMMMHLHKIRAICEKRFEETPKVVCPKIEGTYQMFPRFDYGMKSDELQKYMLDKARLGFASGTHYGPGGEGHLRLVIATSEAIINEIFDRMQETLKNLV